MSAAYAYDVGLYGGQEYLHKRLHGPRSLVNGEGRTFYEEAMERHELYVDESIMEVEIRPYSARPALFDFDDLTKETGNWLNLAVTEYFHKTYVKLVEEAE